MTDPLSPASSSPRTASSREARRRTLTFLFTLVITTAGATVLARGLGGSPWASLAVMWSPGLAALAASVLTRRRLREVGWRPWPARWPSSGWVLPVVYALPAYAAVWLTSLGGVPESTMLERARLTLDMPAGSDEVLVLAAFGYITLVGLLPAVMMSLGEEVGGRGGLTCGRML